MIVGAGLAGLIAAHAFASHEILEASPEPRQAHRALLRFRSDAVARLTGIEFRPVTVRKGIWSEGAFQQPTIRVANLYGQKCLGSIFGDRSIWNLDPATRWIAPESFYEQLVENVKARLFWDSPVDFNDPPREGGPLISTAPLPVVLGQLSIPRSVEFTHAPIAVERYRVPGADAHQTIYFPDPETSVYRASITGDLLIVEHAGIQIPYDHLNTVCQAFALPDNLEPIDTSSQRYGKIAPIHDDWRRAMLARLTAQHGIYSIGRFATWRNILLDDVVQDAAVIRRLMRSDAYAHRLST